MKSNALLLTVAAVSLTRSAAAEGPKVEVYGTLVPYLEYVNTSGATAPGFANVPSQVAPTAYTGVNDPGRFRMTAGTSNLGFRGTLDLVENLKVTWQIESGVPIDGSPGPNTIASRNSHVGLTGDWGTLIWGIWDTPYKWSTLVTINPLKAGYVPDYNSILDTPGFGVGALNTALGFSPGAASNAAFYRREFNSIQYWSPPFAGFSVRLDYSINEGRTAATTNAMGMAVPSINPFLVSGYVSYDNAGFRIRYAFELHHDYFGMAQLGGSPGPSAANPSSTDMGHQVVAQYATSDPDFRTRLVAAADFLRYKAGDTNPDAVNVYSRAAFYGLIEQSIFQHHIWAAYGQAFPGSCDRVGGAACVTDGLGAKLGTLGYLYRIADSTDLYAAGYRIFNDDSARYVTFPPLSTNAPGADTMGVGIGILYSFQVALTPKE